MKPKTMQAHNRDRTINPSILITATTWLLITMMVDVAVSEPQANLLNKGCSQYNASDLSDFYKNQNATFADIRAQLNDAAQRFATASKARSSSPVYAMAQCRSYLSAADCVACYDVAVLQIRNCSGANGARVIYDGCFLRYESNSFYEATTMPGDQGICGNRTASGGSAFQKAAVQLLTDLQAATPKIKGFYAAGKQALSSGTGTVYGVAQCAETVSQSGCENCLAVADANLQSCPPNAEGRAIDAGCFLRYSDTPFFPDDQTTDLAPFLAAGGSRKKMAVIGGVAGGLGFLLILLVIGFSVWYTRKPKAAFRGDILGATELQGPVSYSYKDLKSATKGFSGENKLGEGGFGDVYKGTLKNGKIVAVKKLAIGQSQRAKADFESEVKLISNVHHRHLIRLLGCCSKGPELLLVYEYMANSSLDRFLFGERRGSLNWKQRLDIIVGTARGLAYLHEEFHVCIIHRDIKTSNILLDDGLQPKIADFGLARLLPGDQSHLSTNFAGTLGYTAPEYAIHGQLSEKVDTYSYGVVILEIISGHKSNELKADAEHEFLLEQAWKLYENGRHLELVDDTLDPNEYEAEYVEKLIGIALMCIQSSPSARPSMTEVVVMLKSKSSLEHTPLTRPTFVEHRPRTDTSTSTGSSTSNATASFSHFSGR